MPTPTRAYVKTAFVCLALGAILGALMLTGRWLPLGPVVDYVRVAHAQLMIAGWLTQLVLGVAWWLFPPLPGLSPATGSADRPARRGQARRGSERLFWLTYALLNAAVVLRSIADPLYSLTHRPLFSLLTGLSAVCLAVTAVTFLANMWPRVRELAGHR